MICGVGLTRNMYVRQVENFMLMGLKWKSILTEGDRLYSMENCLKISHDALIVHRVADKVNTGISIADFWSLARKSLVKNSLSANVNWNIFLLRLPQYAY